MPPTPDTIRHMIEWTPALSTGVALLDEQHKAIFKWLAELESATVDERTLFGAYAITRLKNYTLSHFTAEETLMKEARYADLEKHIAEHDAFRARLAELHLRSISEDITTEVVTLLRDWLVNHITTVDMAYVPSLKKHR